MLLLKHFTSRLPSSQTVGNPNRSSPYCQGNASGFTFSGSSIDTRRKTCADVIMKEQSVTDFNPIVQVSYQQSKLGSHLGRCVHHVRVHYAACPHAVALQPSTWKRQAPSGLCTKVSSTGAADDLHWCQIFYFSTAVQTNEIPSFSHHSQRALEWRLEFKFDSYRWSTRRCSSRPVCKHKNFLDSFNSLELNAKQ